MAMYACPSTTNATPIVKDASISPSNSAASNTGDSTSSLLAGLLVLENRPNVIDGAEEGSPQSPRCEAGQPSSNSSEGAPSDSSEKILSPQKTRSVSFVASQTHQHDGTYMKKGDRLSRARASHPQPPPTAVCGICHDRFYQFTSSLAHVARSLLNLPSYAGPVGFAVALSCRKSHKYCFGCLRGYIQSKIEMCDETGGESLSIRCPECPWTDDWRISDEVVAGLLEGDTLEVWSSKKLRHSLNLFTCPNTYCGALIEEPNIRLPKSLTEFSCPMCLAQICANCRLRRHPGRGCSEDESVALANAALYSVAQLHGWRRCPRCRILVERTFGCSHILCRCGCHFCYRCGSKWRWRKGCTRPGGCRFGVAYDPSPWPEVHGHTFNALSTLSNRQWLWWRSSCPPIYHLQKQPLGVSWAQQFGARLRQKLSRSNEGASGRGILGR